MMLQIKTWALLFMLCNRLGLCGPIIQVNSRGWETGMMCICTSYPISRNGSKAGVLHVPFERDV